MESGHFLARAAAALARAVTACPTGSDDNKVHCIQKLPQDCRARTDDFPSGAPSPEPPRGHLGARMIAEPSHDRPHPHR